MSYATIVLSGPYREIEAGDRSLITRIAERHAFHYSAFVAQLHAIRRKRRVKSLLIECREDFLTQFSSAAETIRRDLTALREGGIELHFHAPRYNEASLYIASACNARYIAPLGTISLSGFGRTFLFFKGLLDRKGVRAEVFKRGVYKSAADALQSDVLHPAVQRQYQEFYDVQQREFYTAVCDGLGKPLAQVEALINGRVIHDHEAISEGWVNEIASIGELVDRWKALKNKPKKIKTRCNGYGRGKQVAVLSLEGPIVEGKSRRDPLLGNAVGSRSLVTQITELRKNKRCVALVLRINSPGGSAAASELIRHEIARLAETKPLVVSMSTVAASGGYWIASAAPLILAERTTLTGSIGVIALILTAPKLFSRLGITHHALKTGPFRDIGSPLRAMSTPEKRLVDAEIEYIYQRFLELVAASRKISLDHAHELAKGRIWDGAEALQQRLVDEIGGLPQAIDRAAAMAGISPTAVRFYPQRKATVIERLLTNRAAAVMLSGHTGIAAPLLSESLHNPVELIAALEALRRTPLAILPQALYSTLHSMLSSI